MTSGWGVSVLVRDVDDWTNAAACKGTVLDWGHRDWTNRQVRITDLIHYAHTQVARPVGYNDAYATEVYYKINHPLPKNIYHYLLGDEIVTNPTLYQLVYEFQREDYDFNGFTLLVLDRFERP